MPASSRVFSKHSANATGLHPEGLRAEYVWKVNPKAYEEALAAEYIKGVVEEAPSVIALNLRVSSAVVSEFLARAFPFRRCRSVEPVSLETERLPLPFLAAGRQNPMV